MVWVMLGVVRGNVWDNLFSNQKQLGMKSSNFLIKAQSAEGKRF